MKRIAFLLTMLLLVPRVFGAGPSHPTTSPDGQAVSLRDLAQQLEAMKAMLQAQQQQIESLQQQLMQRTRAEQPPPGEPWRSAETAPTITTAAPTPSANSTPAASVDLAPRPRTESAALPATARANPGLLKQANASEPPAQIQTRPEAIELAEGKIRLGFTLYADWGMYFKTGFGPQFLTHINQPGPGNDKFDSFDITRTYLNFYYSPNDAITLRITPNIYRQLASETAVRFGQSGAVPASGNGNLTFRLKYAYIDFNKPFAGSETFGKDVVTIGQQTNPLNDWQEAFYGYRFTSLVPWNYLSLSSTHTGISVHGPVTIHQKQYLDYAVGVFDAGSFRNQEQAAEKQVMARLSFYPKGATSRFGGLGLTGFVDYGFANNAPDLPNNSVYRVAAMVHYWAKNFNLAAEYDYGKDAFGVGNLFSGSGPADAFGLGPTPYAGLAATARRILALGAQQQGYDVLGHIDIPHSPFSVFGLYQHFQPNTNVSRNPLDFSRVVAGVSYRYNSHLRFALDSQNLLFSRHTAVPTDTNAVFLNVELNY
jgi:hypothetical protein